MIKTKSDDPVDFGIRWTLSAEQTSSVAARIETDYIARMSIDKTVTLLCQEHENEPHCHRHILSKTVDEIVNQISAR